MHARDQCAQTISTRNSNPERAYNLCGLWENAPSQDWILLSSWAVRDKVNLTVNYLCSPMGPIKLFLKTECVA